METPLDNELLAITEDGVKGEFQRYKVLKTDLFVEEPEIKIQMGADGVTHEAFEKQLDRHARNVVGRIADNRYFFGPFREVTISKDYTLKTRTAIAKGKTRTLSVANIRDVLVQRLLHRIVGPHAERLFRRSPQLDNASFAYRSGKSAPAAARQTFKYVQDGYTYVLDADIRKFFDEIPHDKLLAVLDDVFGPNLRVRTLLKRFVKADRVEWDWYKRDPDCFYTEKAKRTPRKIGIPQGGVLSGLVANLYLHQFDTWVVEELASLYDIRYIRYADDFVIMAKDAVVRDAIEPLVRARLDSLGLFLHTDRSKTRLLDLSKKSESLDFVGFNISPTGIRVKNANMTKFRRRFSEKLWEKIKWKSTPTALSALEFVVRRKLQFKVLGNWAEGMDHCDVCALPVALRSWVAFFATITDVQQLRGLDRWIRRALHSYVHMNFGVRIGAKELQEAGLSRLEDIYYSVRRHIDKLELCKCEPWESKEARLRIWSERRSALADLFDEVS